MPAENEFAGAGEHQHAGVVVDFERVEHLRPCRR